MNTQTQKVNGQAVLPLPEINADAHTPRTRMTVTPMQAAAWLQHNTHNRKLRESVWTAYGVDMLEGRWKYNHMPIIFGRDGILLDGQHRLKACAEAGVPFVADVIFGADPDIMDTIDINLARTGGDRLSLDGVPNSNSACALAGMLITHKKHGIHRMNNPLCKPTRTEAVAMAKRDPLISEVCGHAGYWFGRAVPQRIVTFCYYLFAKQDHAKAETFFSQLRSGENLAKGNPVYHLRERVYSNSRAKSKLPFLEVLALFFKAWTAFRDGKRVSHLRWISVGDKAEPFPSIGTVSY